MIITCKKKIPLHWMLLTIMPWASWMFVVATMSTVSLYSLKKFVENPAGLTFVMSLPTFSSMLLGPIVSFMSDRIWTSYGRRKPFVLFAWSLGAVCVALMPLMQNFWMLLIAYLLFYVASDFQGPQEPLKLEVIPPQQRGRAVAAVSWVVQLGLLLFFFVAFGRFDDKQFLFGFPLTGEETIYWAAAASMVVMILFIALGIKEVDPKSPIRGERLSVKNLFRGITARDLWPVYTLIFASAMLGAGLGTLGNLLYTEQWRFTKQEMGNNVAIGAIINLAIIPVLGIFADRWNRVRAYQTLIVLGILCNLSFYIYVNFMLYDRRPILLELVLFGEMLSILGILTSMAFTPMVFDYVPRNEMGTYMAGQNLLQRVIGLITLNGVGLFVWGYSAMFMPQAGDMTRVVFRENVYQADLGARIAGFSWQDPVTGAARPAREVKAEPWYATGAVLDYGRCFEFRLENKASARIREERDGLEEQRAEIAKDEAAVRERIRRKIKAGASPEAPEIARLSAEADALKARTVPLADQIAAKEGELKRRGEALRAQVLSHFHDVVMQPGEQIVAARVGRGTLLELPVSSRLTAVQLEKVLLPLRRLHPDVLDLRPVQLVPEGGFGVALSLKGEPDESHLVALRIDLAAEGHRRYPHAFGAEVEPVRRTIVPLFETELVTIEDPLDLHPSPVSRLVDFIQSLFTDVPGAERRINAMGRALRQPGFVEHVKVEAVGGHREHDNSVRIFAVLVDRPPPLPEPDAFGASPPAPEVVARYRTLLGEQPAAREAQILDLYTRSLDAGREQRTTIAEPINTSGYAPMKYDYMSGYLWMLILSLIGLGITVLFIRREKRGLIRKRGLEEALAR